MGLGGDRSDMVSIGLAPLFRIMATGSVVGISLDCMLLSNHIGAWRTTLSADGVSRNTLVEGVSSAASLRLVRKGRTVAVINESTGYTIGSISRNRLLLAPYTWHIKDSAQRLIFKLRDSSLIRSMLRGLYVGMSGTLLGKRAEGNTVFAMEIEGHQTFTITVYAIQPLCGSVELLLAVAIVTFADLAAALDPSVLA